MTTPALRATYPDIDWERVSVFPMSMPSRRMMLLVLPCPTTQADRNWLARLVAICPTQEEIDLGRAVKFADIDPIADACRFAPHTTGTE